MLLLILFIIYIVSFFLVRYIFRLFSSKGFGIYEDKNCQLHAIWYFPVVNSVAVLFLFFILLSSIPEIIKNKPKWKLFNWDL